MLNHSRSGRSAPVSLFAFQDIIMGVTGVMLILVLTLVVRWRPAAPEEAPERPATPEEKTTARLAAEERELLRELDELRRRVRLSGAEQVRRERVEALEETRKRLEAREEELRRELAALPDAGPAAPPDELFLRVRELQAKRRRWEQKYLDKSRRPEPPERYDGRATVFLECRDRDFLLTLPGAAPRRLGAQDALPLPAARRELFAVLRELPGDRHWLAVAVHPGAGPYIAMLLAALREEFPGLPVSAEPLGAGTDGGRDAAEETK